MANDARQHQGHYELSDERDDTRFRVAPVSLGLFFSLANSRLSVLFRCLSFAIHQAGDVEFPPAQIAVEFV